MAGSRPRPEPLLEKASRFLEAARRERDLGNLDLAAGHAYYGMFYVAEALLEHRGRRFSKHGAVHGAYGREFARTKDLDPRYHRWLLDAFRERITAHYEVETEFDPEAIDTMIERADEFLRVAEEYLG